MKKSVAVIGVGVSGLTMIKACLEQNLDVVAYELADTVGGLWCYREDTSPEKERSVVHACTHMNSSKEISALSDFPPPDHYPNYMRHNLVHNYFESYAERYDLKKYIKFHHKVLEARENNNHGGNVKKWTVEVMDISTSTVSRAEFDAIAICAGQLNKPFRPPINGLENFKGDVLHSVSYRTPEKFKGKRIAVIGIGNSGADIAVDVAPVASEVFISSRKGTWIFGRPGHGGLPNDLKIFSRMLLQTSQYFPKFLLNKYLLKSINSMLDHRVYGLEPKHGPLENTPTLNDELPHKILTGDIKLKKGVLEVLEDGIHFLGDEKRTALDAIVLATGFIPTLPFLDIAEEEFWTDSSLNLYKCIFPPDHGDGTLGFIGYSIPLGGVFPFVELQGRFFAAVVAGKANLPTIEEMKTDIRIKDDFNRKTYAPGERQVWFTDFIPYMDDLASRIGAKPNLISMLFKDPALWYNCFFGPITGYQYRLQGPHAWSGAREAIMTYYDRVLKPFQF